MSLLLNFQRYIQSSCISNIPMYVESKSSILSIKRILAFRLYGDASQSYKVTIFKGNTDLILDDNDTVSKLEVTSGDVVLFQNENS